MVLLTNKRVYTVPRVGLLEIMEVIRRGSIIKNEGGTAKAISDLTSINFSLVLAGALEVGHMVQNTKTWRSNAYDQSAGLKTVRRSDHSLSPRRSMVVPVASS